MFTNYPILMGYQHVLTIYRLPVSKRPILICCIIYGLQKNSHQEPVDKAKLS